MEAAQFEAQLIAAIRPEWNTRRLPRRRRGATEGESPIPVDHLGAVEAAHPNQGGA
jgi:hypothetical protein